MPESDDIALLKQFTEENSEAAFTALVERHVNLVYSAALRSVGNPHAAQEISQAVFIILARKARSLGDKTVLSGWLYQTTRLTAANYLRGEIRRHGREQEAYMQSTLNEPAPEVWRQIAPLLDDAMGRLGEKDRNAIVLRFFENKNLAEVGAALGASEDAAKMRVNRALEKLRKFFGKRGVDSTTAILSGAISANSIHTAPVGLAKTISAVVIAKGAAASISTLTLAKGALKIMAWTKVKTAAVVGVCVLLTAGTATTIIICNKPRPVQGIPQDWSVLSGTSDQWSWTNGAIKGGSNTGDSILASSKKYGDITLSAIASTSKRGADFAIRMQDADNGYIAVFTPDGTPWAVENGSCIKLEKRVAGDTTELGIFKRRGLPQSAKITVTAKGPQIEVRLDDATVLKIRDTTFSSGYIGLRVYGDTVKPSDSTFSNLMFY